MAGGLEVREPFPASAIPRPWPTLCTTDAASPDTSVNGTEAVVEAAAPSTTLPAPDMTPPLRALPLPNVAAPSSLRCAMAVVVDAAVGAAAAAAPGADLKDSPCRGTPRMSARLSSDDSSRGCLCDACVGVASCGRTTGTADARRCSDPAVAPGGGWWRRWVPAAAGATPWTPRGCVCDDGPSGNGGVTVGCCCWCWCWCWSTGGGGARLAGAAGCTLLVSMPTCMPPLSLRPGPVPCATRPLASGTAPAPTPAPAPAPAVPAPG